MNVRRLLRPAAAASLLSAALVAGGCGAISPYAARVNGVTLSQRALDGELRAILANKQYVDRIDANRAQSGGRARGSGQDTFDSDFVAQILTRGILYEVIGQGLAHRHLKVATTDRDGARDELRQSFGGDVAIFNHFSKSYRDLLVLRQAEVDVLQRALSKVRIDAASIKQLYDQNQAQFSQTCARHILALLPQDHTPTAEEDAAARAKAQSWKARLDKGGDFAALAKAESEDTGSRPSGGDLGCQAKGQFVAEFETAEAALQPGQISAPVKSQFGYHIIQVTARKTQSLEEATPAIRQQLQQADQGAITQYLDTALERAKIVVNPRYGQFVKDAPQPGVVPPKAPSVPTTTAPSPLGQGGQGQGGQGQGGQGQGQGGQPSP